MRHSIQIFTINRIFTLSVVLLFSFDISCQVDVSKAIVNKCQGELQEKLFVHLAKNTVTAGQEIYYKGYLAGSSSNKKTIVYFDIINDKGSQLASWKSNIIEGTTSGKYIIPDTISSGIYMLRSYTRWMMSSSNYFVFQTPVMIINLADNEPGVLSKINYNTNTDYLNNSSLEKLPIKLDVSISNNVLKLEIDSIKNYYKCEVLALLHGETIFKEPLLGTSSNYSFEKNISGQKSGTINTLIINQNGNILKEKTVFYNAQSDIDIKIDQLNSTYIAGDTIQFKVSVIGKKTDKKLNLSCSVAKRDELSFLPPTLTISDYINYFSEYSTSGWYNSYSNNSNIDSIKSNLQWQKAIWNNLNSEVFKNDTIIKEPDACLLSGRITEKITGGPVSKTRILLSVAGKVPLIDYSITNSNGEFFFWLDSSLDNANIILQVYDNFNRVKNADIFWQIYNNNIAVMNLSKTPIQTQGDDLKKVDEIKQLSLVNRVYFEKKENKSELNGDVHSTITYQPNYFIDPSDYELLENFQDIAANILPGVALKQKRKIWMLQIIDPNEKMVLDSGSMVLLNGVPFKNLEYIAKLPVNDIERIEVYQSNFFYGQLNFQGIVAIYTHEKSLPLNYLANETYIYKNMVQPVENIIVLCEPNKELYNPNFKDLLYWNPFIIFEKDDSYIVKFPASLYKGRYDIKLEGISDSGEPISTNQSFIIE